MQCFFLEVAACCTLYYLIYNQVMVIFAVILFYKQVTLYVYKDNA